MLVGYGTSGSTHDFFVYNDDGEIWNGSAFVTWVNGDYTTYRVTATETGASGRFTQSTVPAGGSRYELRVRSATLAGSYVTWEENILSDGDVIVAVQPIIAEVTDDPIASSAGGTVRALTYFMRTTNAPQWRIIDAAEDPVDLTGHTFAFVVQERADGTEVFAVENADIDLTASDPGEPTILDTITVNIDESLLTAKAVHEYVLWDLTSETVYGAGQFVIKQATRPS
jgi:hypothetical protein